MYLRKAVKVLDGGFSQISRNQKCLDHYQCILKKFYSSKKEIDIDKIRNFSIIAHVDHGKSTLADRLLEMTGAITPTSENKQVLDRLQVEKERGITVKAVAASLNYTYNGNDYLFNLIDTPGHVDFSNEVNRSLFACQGVILLVDANQGIQAQTVANFYLAFTMGKEIIPVLNKVDLKNANPDKVEGQLQSLFDIDPSTVLRISAKTGLGVEQLLQAIVERVPPPESNRSGSFRALVVDSWFDRYKGVIAFTYIADGSVRVGEEVSTFHGTKSHVIKALGKLRPHEEPCEALHAGEVGFIVCGMKSYQEAQVGDTFYLSGTKSKPLPTFDRAKPMVFSGLFPSDQSQYTNLRSSLERLCLNDPAVSVATDSSPALGQGWRIGFLGLLHLEVFSQRLEQEFGTTAILTAPSVTYKFKIIGAKNIKKYRSDELFVSNPVFFPDPSIISEMYEPMVLTTIITPSEYLGPITTLCLEKRGVQINSSNIDNDRLLIKYKMPLNEIVIDFHDHLKSLSSGFASFDYEEIGFEESSLTKISILLNDKPVDELSCIVHTSKASLVARQLVLKLKETIPRQMVMVAIQAAVGGNILARETIKPFRKDVTAKLYGGDVTRRMKLLKQQSEGKKKMRMIANIQVPKDTFINILKHS